MEQQSGVTSGQEMQPSMGMALKVWWAYTWRLILASFVIMIPVQILLAVLIPQLNVANAGGFPFQLIPIFIILWLVMFVGMIALQVFFFKVILKKEFSDFKITVLRK